MKKKLLILSGFLAAAVLGISSTALGGAVTTKWGGDAKMLYDNGFMHMLMKDPKGGVRLFNMDLVENDSPGAGTSEKGESRDAVWGKNQARKILFSTIRAPKRLFLCSFLPVWGNIPSNFQ